MCLTSNVLTQTVPSYNDHHCAYWSKAGHPIALCVGRSVTLFASNSTLQTDDFGIFDTTLSREMELYAQTFNATRDDLKTITRHSLDAAFCSDPVKQSLHQRLQ